MERLSAHTAQIWLSGKPCICNSRSGHMIGKDFQYWLSLDSRILKWPLQKEKLEMPDLAKLEASQHCGGTQSLVRWLLLSLTGGVQTFCPHSNAAEYFPGTSALARVHVFMMLPWQPARRSQSPPGNRLQYQCPLGCCLGFPYYFLKHLFFLLFL